MEIDKESTRKAIYGDRYALLEAFEWEFTPQGHEYWAEQYHGNKPVDVETLRKMIGDGDTPKTWGEMTDSEKGALLLAAHEGKVIEVWHEDRGCFDLPISRGLPMRDWNAYRVRPEPKLETVTLHGRKYVSKTHPEGLWDLDRNERRDGDTHRITFDLIDGEPDLGSIRMERV